MPGPAGRHLVSAGLAPLDELEAALQAAVRGQLHGARLQHVAELLGGRPAAAPGVRLPAALLERRVCALDAE